jgi:hypothetical protein
MNMLVYTLEEWESYLIPLIEQTGEQVMELESRLYDPVENLEQAYSNHLNRQQIDRLVRTIGYAQEKLDGLRR